MDQVAEHSGVSKQTVYSHFGSKEDLFTAIIEYKCIAADITNDLFDLERPIREVLRELADHFIELMMSDEAIRMFRLCVADTGQRARLAALYWEAGPHQVIEKIEHYMSEQKRRGKLHIDDPHFATQHFIALTRGEGYMKKLLGLPDQRNPKELPDYIDSCIELFARAYIDR
ncbi:hypothetical protein LCGC14_2867200 [marine sediment metagenome]|uniref:HTH tetR-type domain-containing protein n=1 Tax=marine sediment metagenome TaxID=412755 RepID=A0A0F9AC72_9ZZZZ